MHPKANYILDLRQMIAPFTLLKASQVFSKMEADETLEIMACDTETEKSLFKILAPQSYELLRMDYIEESEAYFRIQLKKV